MGPESPNSSPIRASAETRGTDPTLTAAHLAAPDPETQLTPAGMAGHPPAASSQADVPTLTDGGADTCRPRTGTGAWSPSEARHRLRASAWVPRTSFRVHSCH